MADRADENHGARRPVRAGNADGAVAAVDCGTNSTRLLITKDGETLDRRMVITRMGQGVDSERRFHPDALDRVFTTLTEYRSVMDEHGVERVRAVATSAARDVRNADDLLDRAEQILGVRPEILGGDEEGRLSFAGATAELDPADGPYLIVDIGGGSTEVAVGTTEPEGVISLDVGCVRITEQYIHSDPPRPEELSAALQVIEAHLDDVARELPQSFDARTLVGLAGTVSTVAAVELGLPAYDRDRIHHFRLTHEAAEDVFRTLVTESREQRLHNPGLEEARADVIVGGCLVLVKLFRYFGFDDMLVSESDILDGLAASIT